VPILSERRRMAAEGHEGQFPPAKLNGRYRFKKRSIAVSDCRTRTFETGS